MKEMFQRLHSMLFGSLKQMDASLQNRLGATPYFHCGRNDFIGGPLVVRSLVERSAPKDARSEQPTNSGNMIRGHVCFLTSDI